eukprot:125153-Rhodomonas_salina.1
METGCGEASGVQRVPSGAATAGAGARGAGVGREGAVRSGAQRPGSAVESREQGTALALQERALRVYGAWKAMEVHWKVPRCSVMLLVREAGPPLLAQTRRTGQGVRCDVTRLTLAGAHLEGDCGEVSQLRHRLRRRGDGERVQVSYVTPLAPALHRCEIKSETLPSGH